MKGLVQFDAIKSLPFSDALEQITLAPKLNFGSLTVADLCLSTTIPAMRIYENWHQQLYGFGAYVFFDADKPVYVGKAKDFLRRFQSMLHFDGRPDWAYNELARKVAERKLGNRDLAMVKDTFHQLVIPELDNLDVVRVNMLNNSVPAGKMTRLESLLRKGYADSPYGSVYNGLTNAGKYDARKSLAQLMN